MSSHKKSIRESEIALLTQISTSLDSRYGAPDPARLHESRPASERRAAQSKSPKTTNFLMVKTVVKGIVKACVQEKLGVTERETKSVGVIDSIVEEYRLKYPKLTKQMVMDAVARHRKSNENDASPGENKGEIDDVASDDANHEIKLGRCIEIVEEEIAAYHEKIEALKRKRELAATMPEPEPEKKKRRRKRKSSSAEGGDGNDDVGEGDAPPDGEPQTPKGRGRPRKNTPETALIKEITERYARERETADRLPNGAFEAIVHETKKDFGMEDFDLSLERIRKRVTWNFMHRRDNGDGIARKQKRDVYEEVYKRYARAKKSNGRKLPKGVIKDIIDAVKLEHGVTDVKMTPLETKVQVRFKKENPDFVSLPPVALPKLSEEDKKRRQTLLNEITKRYVKLKEGCIDKSLADGELGRIIRQTKDDLGIHDFDVPRETIIEGRVEPPSAIPLGKESSYDAIDGPLVATINAWLSQGVSVTRAQGLEFANALLRGTKVAKDAKTDGEGNEMLLDAKWWRAFLERNKRKLVCS